MSTLPISPNLVTRFTHPTLKRWTADVKRSPAGRLYVITCDHQEWWNANPLRLDNGRILYDSPERVPAYAKALTAKAYRWIDAHDPQSN